MNRRERRLHTWIVLWLTGAVLGCSAEDPSGSAETGRWYTADQVTQGRALFRTQCASCHGESAEGGISLGGVMPGFAETLRAQEVRATIAYFQSFWPDDIYARWQCYV